MDDRRVDDRAHDGGGGTPEAAQHVAVEAFEGVGRSAALGEVGAQDVAHLGHLGGGHEAVTGDVPNDHSDVFVVDGQHVVPVAADLAAAG